MGHSNSPNENEDLIEHNMQSIMEQIKECNEDTEQTRIMVSRLVSKPKCSDKLLSKPPFRFLHDLIVAIANTTQFDLHQIFR